MLDGKLILPVIKYTKNALLCVSKMLSIEKYGPATFIQHSTISL